MHVVRGVTADCSCFVPVAAFSAMATVGIAPAGADDDVCVALHKREKSGMGYWGHPGICTVTFCQGDAEQVFAALKPKVRAAIDANPWIAGRLSAAKTLVHPKVGSDDLVDGIARHGLADGEIDGFAGLVEQFTVFCLVDGVQI